MNFTRREAEKFLVKQGYEFITLRKLIHEFDNNSDKNIIEKLGLKKHYLNYKFAYKNKKEKNEIIKRIGIFINNSLLNKEMNFYFRIKISNPVNIDIVKDEKENYKNSLYNFSLTNVFREHIRNILYNSIGVKLEYNEIQKNGY